jgi:allantoicase
MPKYKVLGRKMFDYMITIEAASLDEAYDKAMQAEAIEWSSIVNDDVIEPTEVYEYELSLNEDDLDEWPQMTSGAVIGA